MSTIRLDPSTTSLSVNYLPTKFSSSLLAATPRRRKPVRTDVDIPKRGGGIDAFRPGEARMPEQGDEDYDGVQLSGGIFGNGDHHSHRRMRWNKFKWILFVSNVVLTVYSIVGLLGCLLTWFNVFVHSDIIRVANRTQLIISTLATTTALFTSLIGWAGILLNNRSFLAVYNLFLWISFIFLVVPGYLTYKQRTFNLEGKINAQWSTGLGASGRLRIQNELQCCGYFSPFIEATVSQTCYARTVLPGCKMRYINFQREALKTWYTVAFSIVPVNLVIMLVALICSNHVTYRFGKGMMPKAYRLNMNSVAVIMDNYAERLAEEYGVEGKESTASLREALRYRDTKEEVESKGSSSGSGTQESDPTPSPPKPVVRRNVPVAF